MRAILVALLCLFQAQEAWGETLRIAYLGQERTPAILVSPLDSPAANDGLAGARLGIDDNNTTGRFTGQHFELTPTIVPRGGDPIAAIRAIAASKIRLVVADVDSEALRAIAADPQARDLLILNSRAPDDALRDAACRPNLLHVAASRAMLADALAQYLAVKRWVRWFLVVGRSTDSILYAEALKRSAARFGAEIVVEKAWNFQHGHGRADTGHVTLQTEIPAFTNVPDHDILVVADEANEFGEFLPGRTYLPRPVAGTHGLVAAGFHPVNEQWGAAQIHSRFQKLAGRRMGAVDYAGWTAVRAIGEAAIRTGSTEPGTIWEYLRGPEFLLSGFKGQGQSFRAWDGQMRQPILIAGPRVLVSVSPQPGFLHRGSELDTLGYDEGESRCHFAQ